MILQVSNFIIILRLRLMAITRYKDNPFIENMVVPSKSKTVKLSRLGQTENILINQSTGEMLGTHITTYREVDSQQFVKLFTQNIALTFDLKSSGLKALNVLIWAVQHKAISKDQVDMESLTLDEFLESHSVKLSLATFTRGINELEKAQILAKALKKGRYFINPNFVFNGDRIAFTTLIERRKKERNEEQQELLIT